MTTYTFVPNSSQQFVNWSSPAIWSPAVVPNGASADVVIPGVTYANTDQYYTSFISISNQSYSINSLSIAENILTLSSANLAIAGALDIAAGGEIDVNGVLSAGSVTNNGVDIQGQGTVSSSGTFLNESKIVGEGLSVTAPSFDNVGSLVAASGDLTINVTPGGFANLSGSTLSGGTYSAGTGNTPLDTLLLNVGGVITIDAANIILNSDGEIESSASPQSTNQTIESTLRTVAASGVLTLNNIDSWGALTIDGLLVLGSAAPPAVQQTFSVQMTTLQLTVDASGTVMGLGQLSGPIIDNGAILVGLTLPAYYAGSNPGGSTLDITGPISGSGTITFEPTPFYSHGSIGGTSYYPWTLQLDGRP
jgi:hypothetical protein